MYALSTCYIYTYLQLIMDAWHVDVASCATQQQTPWALNAASFATHATRHGRSTLRAARHHGVDDMLRLLQDLTLVFHLAREKLERLDAALLAVLAAP